MRLRDKLCQESIECPGNVAKKQQYTMYRNKINFLVKRQKINISKTR